jgi:hypothetical protein
MGCYIYTVEVPRIRYVATVHIYIVTIADGDAGVLNDFS